MRLVELVQQLGGSLLPAAAGSGPEIAGVRLDSRRVAAGDLFSALPGTRADGATFARDALARGAAAILTPRALELPTTAVQWVHADARAVAGRAAAALSGHPGAALFVVGITGTNGKTTTAHLTGQILEHCGRRPAVLGTAGNRLADGLPIPATHTTPDACALQELLVRHREMGGDSVAMEVSSHALDQDRTAGLEFDVAAFTNLTRDHLDYHVDLERYAEAKERLFRQIKRGGAAVVNADDPVSERMARVAKESGASVYTYSARLRGDLCASHVQTGLRGTQLFLHGMGISRTRAWLPLAGRYNVENALAALASALLSGASPSKALEGLATVRSAPGRLEPVPNDHGIAVLVDYAHSEAALENVLRVVRASLEREPAHETVPQAAPVAGARAAAASAGRLIVVFGCGGDRDRGKRGPMGRVVNELADVAIVTSDNPRSEDPERILAEITAGMQPALAERVVLPDRRDAIARALELARPGDAVLIAGKGHETTQTIGTKVYEFDDRKVAAECLR
ncbi:MAG: UDP-N-acetylmuramoyl-L-alanyl-D-glutamate--2,6-diaminopimelate ligase [Planctomycetes bacterium]|nr:UDP-N-acetylmuramoyl-L-alanyl-D-glutamate--2,6-diaminopimelate ligase [Planctomycetota bacterium]